MKKLVFNPLLEDFSVEIDKCGPNHKTITIKAHDVLELEEEEANHLIRHLIDKLIDTNPPADKNIYSAREEWRKVVTV